MKNYWLDRREKRKHLAFEKSLYSHIYLTFGHGRLTALTKSELKAIMPHIDKLRKHYGLSLYKVVMLMNLMRNREKQQYMP